MFNKICARTGLAVFAALATAAAIAAPDIRGDAQLLKTVVNAIKDSSTRYERGRIAALVSRTAPGSTLRADVHMWWDADRVRAEYMLSRSTTDKDGKTIAGTEEGIAIERPDIRLHYFPKVRLLQKRFHPSRRSPSVIDDIHLRPAGLWFTADESNSWVALLDPNKVTSNVTALSAEAGEGGRVLIERHHRSGTIWKITASLERGGNITSLKTVLAPGGPTRDDYVLCDGQYDWTLGADSLPKITRYTYRETEPGNPAHTDIEYVVDVKELVLGEVVPEAMFEETSLNIPSGTKVQKFGVNNRPQGSFVTGRKGSELNAESLDALSKGLKKGFADPTREEK